MSGGAAELGVPPVLCLMLSQLLLYCIKVQAQLGIPVIQVMESGHYQLPNQIIGETAYAYVLGVEHAEIIITSEYHNAHHLLIHPIVIDDSIVTNTIQYNTQPIHIHTSDNRSRMSSAQIYELEPMPTGNSSGPVPESGHNNIKAITYTIVAGSAVCMRLKIQKTGYRLLNSSQASRPACLVLVQKSDSLPSNKIVAPYSLTAAFGSKVTLTRLNLSVCSWGSWVVPQLPEATQLYLYIHPQSVLYSAARDALCESPFIVSTSRQEVLLNVSSLASLQQMRGYGSDALLRCRRLVAENQTHKFTNYLRLNMKGVCEGPKDGKYGSCLFIPNKTKIVLQKAEHYDLNEVSKIISLPKLYAKIFGSSPYLKLGDELGGYLQDRPEKKIVLLRSMKGSGVTSFLHKMSQDSEYSFVKINCHYFASERELIQIIKNSESYSSTVIYIKNIQWLLEVGNDKNDQQEKMKRIIRALEEAFANLGDHSLASHILIIGFTGSSIKFDMTKNASLLYFQMTKQQRVQIFQKVVQYCKVEQKIQIKEPQQVIKLGAHSLGWVTFSKILRRVKRKTAMGQGLKSEDILSQIGKMVSMEKVENIKNVSWDDVGGLEHAKQEIIQTILLPTRHPQIFDEWIKPRTGLLFFGPPGTGKTLLGKCIANECKMGFISVKGPELLNMYIGESEKNVRDVFDRAAASSPCIVFMDELDALIPKRGQSSDSNQVMDRIVSELMAQMDRAPTRGIFIIGATNRPDLLDPSILRPGRFDKQIYLGITTEEKARVQILKAQTRHLRLRQGFDFERVVKQVPQNFTGADFYGLTSRSITKAAQRFIWEYENKQRSQEDEITLNEQDFIETVKSMKPSVSADELARYEKLRQEYK